MADENNPQSWFWGYLKHERSHLKAAPLAFLFVFLAGVAIGFIVAWNVVVASKNATIETLSVSNTQLQNENDRLSKQLSDLKAIQKENSVPLKKRTLILAEQLAEFIQRSKTDQNQFLNEWLDRFYPRVQKVESELDEAGILSEKLELTKSQNLSAEVIQTISEELKKLAYRIPDEK